jgi:hypothetical protein
MTYIMSTTSATEAVLIRRATPADSAGIRTLALLDDKRMPTGPFLVGEIDGELVAARSLSTGTVVADPFRLTSDIVAMLRVRGDQVGVQEPHGRRARRSESRSLALAA